LIEIGRESRASWATKKAADALGGMAALLILVWLVRGLLGIQQYSAEILVASFGLIFLGRVFKTRTSAGTGKAVSSLLWNLAAASIIVVLLTWLLGWVASIQSSVFPASISGRVPDLVIAAIATGLGAYAAHEFSPRRGQAVPSMPPFVVAEGNGPAIERTRLVVKHDTVGVPIRGERGTVGCVLLGDVAATFETPMGTVGASLVGPVVTAGIPFQGRRVGKYEVLKMTGKTPKALIEQFGVDSAQWEIPGRRESVDLPFVHVREDSFGEDVEIGPLKVHEGPDGELVKIGSITIDSDGRRSRRPRELRGRWTAKGAGDSYVKVDAHRVSAKWNGSSLSLDGDYMKLSTGSDSFSYSPSDVITTSPLHTLQVREDKITLDTRKFTLKVSGDEVFLRKEDKTSTTESKALAGDLRALLTETAKKQVKDVMEGTPIDLSEILTATEEVLAKHG